MVAIIDIVDKAGVGEESQRVVRQAVLNVLKKSASDAVYLRIVRAIVVKSVSEELKSRSCLELKTTYTENVKAIVAPSDPRVIEILIPERCISTAEAWRVEGAVAHEVAEARLIVEEEFTWKVVGRLQVFAPYLATLIEDAVRERLADFKICLKGYSGYVYQTFLEDIPLIASEIGRSAQIDVAVLKLITLRGDRSVSLQFSGQKRLGEHAYYKLRGALEEQNPSFCKAYDEFKRKLTLSGEISPFSVEQALALIE